MDHRTDGDGDGRAKRLHGLLVQTLQMRIVAGSVPLSFVEDEELLTGLLKQLLKIYEHNVKVHQALVYAPLKLKAGLSA